MWTNIKLVYSFMYNNIAVSILNNYFIVALIAAFIVTTTFALAHKEPRNDVDKQDFYMFLFFIGLSCPLLPLVICAVIFLLPVAIFPIISTTLGSSLMKYKIRRTYSVLSRETRDTLRENRLL